MVSSSQLLAVVLLTVGAISSTHAASLSVTPASPATLTDVQLQVQDATWSDYRFYYQRDGQTVFLTQLDNSNSATVRLPPGTYTLYADGNSADWATPVEASVTVSANNGNCAAIKTASSSGNAYQAAVAAAHTLSGDDDCDLFSSLLTRIETPNPSGLGYEQLNMLAQALGAIGVKGTNSLTLDDVQKIVSLAEQVEARLDGLEKSSSFTSCQAYKGEGISSLICPTCTYSGTKRGTYAFELSECPQYLNASALQGQRYIELNPPASQQLGFGVAVCKLGSRNQDGTAVSFDECHLQVPPSAEAELGVRRAVPVAEGIAAGLSALFNSPSFSSADSGYCTAVQTAVRVAYETFLHEGVMNEEHLFVSDKFSSYSNRIASNQGSADDKQFGTVKIHIPAKTLNVDPFTNGVENPTARGNLPIVWDAAVTFVNGAAVDCLVDSSLSPKSGVLAVKALGGNQEAPAKITWPDDPDSDKGSVTFQVSESSDPVPTDVGCGEPYTRNVLECRVYDGQNWDGMCATAEQESSVTCTCQNVDSYIAVMKVATNSTGRCQLDDPSSAPTSASFSFCVLSALSAVLIAVV